MHDFKDQTTAMLLARFAELKEQRQNIVKQVGMGRATVDQLNDYQHIRRCMQPLYMTLIRRGYTAAELYQ